MARVPFKLKSSGPFKMMGSSPAKQEFKAERRELTKQVDKSKEPSGKLVNTPEGVEGPKLERIGIKRLPEVPKENWIQRHRRKKGEKIESDMNKKRYPRQKTVDPRPTGPVMPKDHPVTPPTTEQSKKSKGTLKGRTGFQADVVDPVKSKVRQARNLLETNVIAEGQKKAKKAILKGGKKVYDYFTKD